MLQRLARACTRHRWIVIGAWIAILFVLNGAAQGIGPDWRTEFTLPDGEAKEVQDLLEERNPELAGFQASIVVQIDDRFADGVDDPVVRERLEALIEFADAEEHGIAVSSPYDEPSQISQDGTIAYAALDITDRPFEELEEIGKAIRDHGDELEEADPIEGLEVEYGGDLFYEFDMPESEAYGVMGAVIILIVAFGSVLAMGLPIGIALFGLGCATAIVTILSNPLVMPDFTTAMVAMIGIGVGIDYALFIVTRYREALHAGLEVEDAVVEAVDTSGRAVVFAGTTVVIALLGLTLMGLPFVSGIAVAAAIGVLMMVLGSLTLLPALLGWIGRHIDETTRVAVITAGSLVVAAFIGITFDAWAAAGIIAIAGLALFVLSFWLRRPLRTKLPHRRERRREETIWYRWSRVIQRRPWPAMVGAVAVLLVLAVPLLDIRLGFGDYGNAAESQTVRRAYDLLADGFGPGSNGPIIITVQGDAAADPDAVRAFADELRAADLAITQAAGDPPGIALSVVPPAPADDLAMVIVHPSAAPQDEATGALVDRLRDHLIPASGVDAKVGGATAATADFAAYMGSRMPILIGVVLALSFVLLMAVFRSILVPLKAVIMNLLSVGSAYGILVAVFQWGWLSGLIGIDRAGPIEAWIPMFLFAIVFGLSMDYEVFLLSRIKEEYEKTVRRGAPDNATAVADGLAVTARVITAAALIMTCVFGAFVLGDERALKMFGLGLAIAVLVDASIVRMVLVPATMELLGAGNWWLPRWLDRILPKIDVEGHHREGPPTAPPRPEREPELV